MAIAKEISTEQRIVKHCLEDHIQIAGLSQVIESSNSFLSTGPFIGIRPNVKFFWWTFTERPPFRHWIEVLAPNLREEEFRIRTRYDRPIMRPAQSFKVIIVHKITTSLTIKWFCSRVHVFFLVCKYQISGVFGKCESYKNYALYFWSVSSDHRRNTPQSNPSICRQD